MAKRYTGLPEKQGLIDCTYYAIINTYTANNTFNLRNGVSGTIRSHIGIPTHIGVLDHIFRGKFPKQRPSYRLRFIRGRWRTQTHPLFDVIANNNMFLFRFADGHENKPIRITSRTTWKAGDSAEQSHVVPYEGRCWGVPNKPRDSARRQKQWEVN